MTDNRFPFGRPVLPVRGTYSGTRKVFVIGVYPSALHARWIDENGKQLCAALAVDNEPGPFWRGEDAIERIATIGETLPEGAGKLVNPGRTFNGPSGIALDEHHLRPLGLERQDCWITDLQNTYLANRGQLDALERVHARYFELGLPPAHLPARRGTLSTLTDARMTELRAEFEEAQPELVITLGNEPIKVLALGEPLRPETYGRRLKIELFGRQVDLLPLVHPRQSGGLGSHSSSWRDVHDEWLRRGPEN